MIFTEALKALGENKLVVRRSWQNEYVALLPTMDYIWKVMAKSAAQPNGAAGNWLPTLADLNADDWEIYSNDKTLEEEPIAEEQEKVA